MNAETSPTSTSTFIPTQIPITKVLEVATGTFEVTLAPQPLCDITSQTVLGRLSLSKRFYGDLQATGQGEMLAFRTTTQGSAGYVAMEFINGLLQGREGGFVLQHSSTMTRGVPVQSITVVPDSATADLIGLTGSMVITVAEGKHSYRFEYGF
jgi:hypothetical protein